MPEVFYTMLTNAGKAKIANATILNTKVNFSKIAVGDSNGSYYNPTEVQTSLVHEVWQGSVGNIRIDEHNSNWIVVESIIPPTTGGFMIREVGLFDDEGDLLVIAKYPETYKPTANDGTVKELIVKLVLEVANTSVVTLKIDPTIIVATKQDIIDMGNKKANLIHNHNDLYHTKNEISTLLDNKLDIRTDIDLNFKNNLEVTTEELINHLRANNLIITGKMIKFTVLPYYIHSCVVSDTRYGKLDLCGATIETFGFTPKNHYLKITTNTIPRVFESIHTIVSTFFYSDLSYPNENGSIITQRKGWYRVGDYSNNIKTSLIAINGWESNSSFIYKNRNTVRVQGAFTYHLKQHIKVYVLKFHLDLSHKIWCLTMLAYFKIIFLIFVICG